jgi:quercetin dioxygenase-like cupin family protein
VDSKEPFDAKPPMIRAGSADLPSRPGLGVSLKRKYGGQQPYKSTKGRNTTSATSRSPINKGQSMRYSTTRLLPLILVAGIPLLAQGNKPILDNDQVRVLAVTDQPHVKTPLHEHKVNRVMVYLNAGKQEMTQDGRKVLVAYKAGEAKWSVADGMHQAEVVSATPLQIVEVEIKTPGDPAKTINTPLDPVKVDKQDYKVEFENSQVRVVRVKLGAHRKVPEHEHQLNRVVVYLTDQNGSMTGSDGQTTTSQHKAGEVSWAGPAKHREENLMDKPFEAIVVELKN